MISQLPDDIIISIHLCQFLSRASLFESLQRGKYIGFPYELKQVYCILYFPGFQQVLEASICTRMPYVFPPLICYFYHTIFHLSQQIDKT